MRAVVVLSGGQDSALCLALAVKKFGPREVAAITFAYGQRHSVETRFARRLAHRFGVAAHKVVKNKVAPPFTEAEFDILYTCGISYEGSVLDAALSRGIVEKRGSWLSFGDEQLAQGSLATIDYLKANPEVTQKIVDLIKTTPVNPALAKKK